MERKNVEEQKELLLKVDAEIRQQRLEIQIFKVEQWSMEKIIKEMEKAMQNKRVN